MQVLGRVLLVVLVVSALIRIAVIASR